MCDKYSIPSTETRDRVTAINQLPTRSLGTNYDGVRGERERKGHALHIVTDRGGQMKRILTMCLFLTEILHFCENASTRCCFATGEHRKENFIKGLLTQVRSPRSITGLPGCSIPPNVPPRSQSTDNTWSVSPPLPRTEPGSVRRESDSVRGGWEQLEVRRSRRRRRREVRGG
ncbi:unnamed protein product [Pleuronectes platessa]|uniref:Uncharacterized protein n=1 Tax=Pleuronectes platessa TaxID=8262 RepID=A0A9N7VQS2_PLEPL|nr:unnamed protein product [Pleuronectes platessa]